MRKKELKLVVTLVHGLIFGFKAKCAYSALNSGAIDMEVKSNHVSKKETRI